MMTNNKQLKQAESSTPITQINAKTIVRELQTESLRIKFNRKTVTLTTMQPSPVAGLHETSQQVVKLHKPLMLSLNAEWNMAVAVGAFSVTLFFLFTALNFITVIFAFVAACYVWKTANLLSSMRQFDSLEKEITHANIIRREVVKHDGGKGDVSDNYYITYLFDAPKVGTIFFKERIDELLYRQLTYSEYVEVKYVITKPWLAHRCNNNLIF